MICRFYWFFKIFTLKNRGFSDSVTMVLEGRRIAPLFLESVFGVQFRTSRDCSKRQILERAGRKVRTPEGAMPRNRCFLKRGIHAGGSTNSRRTVPQKIDSRWREPAVMVKRCGKSAPREAQATRHGKPHRVQGQIGNPGAARSMFRESKTGFGYRLRRQMILTVQTSGTEFGLYPFQNRLFYLRFTSPLAAARLRFFCKRCGPWLSFVTYRPDKGSAP